MVNIAESDVKSELISQVPSGEDKRTKPSLWERGFETALWSSRWIMLVAVVASLVVAYVISFLATVDVIHVTTHVSAYVGSSLDVEAKESLRTEIVAHIVEIIDGYLLGAMMLIIAFGLYELFISRINAAEKSEVASRLLLIQNLDDLKDRLAKIILLILIVKFFERALKAELFVNAIDLLTLSVGIALIGFAIFISHKKTHTE